MSHEIRIIKIVLNPTKEYPVNLNCSIVIPILNASTIIIEPRYFALPKQSDRSAVRFYDGEIDNRRLIGEYYGIQHFDNTALEENIIHTTGRDLVILFSSGPNKQWHGWGGFQLYFELQEGPKSAVPESPVPLNQRCGGILEEENLYFEWPFGQSKCLWHIPAPPNGFENKITFTELVLPPDVAVLTIWQDKIMPGNEINIDFSDEMESYVSKTAFIIEFTGLDRTKSAFFRLAWEMSDENPDFDINSLSGTCGGILDAKSGHVASPGWPENYPGNSDCTWSIMAEIDEIVELLFLVYDVEDSYDYVDVVETASGLTYYVQPEHSREFQPEAEPIVTVGQTQIVFTSG